MWFALFGVWYGRKTETDADILCEEWRDGLVSAHCLLLPYRGNDPDDFKKEYVVILDNWDKIMRDGSKNVPGVGMRLFYRHCWGEIEHNNEYICHIHCPKRCLLCQLLPYAWWERHWMIDMWLTQIKMGQIICDWQYDG